MLSKKIQTALNDQINAELHSAYIYMAMSAYFEDVSLPGFAHWMKSQAIEEMAHAMRIYNHIVDRDGRVILQPIKEVPKEWKSPLGAFEAAYDHECYITKRIHDLVEIALNEKDRAAYTMLEWFVDEQVEEEATAKGIVDQLKMMGDSGSVLFMIDRELAQRPITMPLIMTGGGE